MKLDYAATAESAWRHNFRSSRGTKNIMVTNPVIDFHTYLGKDAFNDFHLEPEELLKDMDENGIDMAVIAPLQDFPGPDVHSHESVYQAWQDRKSTRLNSSHGYIS